MTELYRRRHPATPDTVPQVRHDVVDILTQAGLIDPGLHAHVALAVSEATGNAVRHAYPLDHADGHVEVAVTRRPHSITVTISDAGSGMDTNRSTEGAGLGLAIMNAEADTLMIQSDGAGTVVKLRFAT